jgi:hypothetical protein
MEFSVVRASKTIGAKVGQCQQEEQGVGGKKQKKFSHSQGGNCAFENGKTQTIPWWDGKGIIFKKVGRFSGRKNLRSKGDGAQARPPAPQELSAIKIISRKPEFDRTKVSKLKKYPQKCVIPEGQ